MSKSDVIEMEGKVVEALPNAMFQVELPNGEQALREVACHPGASAIVDPWGKTLAQAAEHEETITAACDMAVVGDIRQSINVFRDRRPELYNV